MCKDGLRVAAGHVKQNVKQQHLNTTDSVRASMQRNIRDRRMNVPGTSCNAANTPARGHQRSLQFSPEAKCIWIGVPSELANLDTSARKPLRHARVLRQCLSALRSLSCES